MADDPCGATLLAGSVVIPDAIDKVSSAFGGLPTVPSNGTITMGMFQVNADGGGPFTAEINTDATGTSWSVIEVLSQPPGVNGILQSVFTLFGITQYELTCLKQRPRRLVHHCPDPRRHYLHGYWFDVPHPSQQRWCDRVFG